MRKGLVILITLTVALLLGSNYVVSRKLSSLQARVDRFNAQFDEVEEFIASAYTFHAESRHKVVALKVSLGELAQAALAEPGDKAEQDLAAVVGARKHVH